jgi:hypothetical protein
MSNLFKSGSSTLVSKATGSQSIGINGSADYGPSSATGFYNGVTIPSGSRLITYIANSGIPYYHVAPNDAATIFFYKSFGSTGSTITDVLAWAANQPNYSTLSADLTSADLVPSLISSNLILNLDASNATSYPSTGTTWYDLSGNATNASLVNGPTFSSTAGGEFSLDGVNDYINLNYVGSDTGSYTYGCWVKLNQLPPAVSNSTTFMSRGRDYFGNGWNVALSATLSSPYHFNTTLVLTAAGITTPSVACTTSISINTWYYVVGSWNSSTGALKIYINGQLEGTTTTTNTTLRSSTTGWNLGSISNIYYMDCHIAGAQVYSAVLSDSNVLQNYNATKSRFGY